MHHGLSHRHLQTLPREGRGAERVGLERVLSDAGHWIPDIHSYDDRGDGQSLLDGRLGREYRRLPGVYVQRSLLSAVAAGGPAAIGVESGETDSFNGRAVSAERRTVVNWYYSFL